MSDKQNGIDNQSMYCGVYLAAQAVACNLQGYQEAWENDGRPESMQLVVWGRKASLGSVMLELAQIGQFLSESEQSDCRDMVDSLIRHRSGKPVPFADLVYLADGG